MAAGNIINNQCVDASASQDVYWSQFEVAATAGSSSYYVIAAKSGNIWQLITHELLSNTDTVISTSNVPYITYPACDTMTNFNDGMQLGWGVALAMAGAWALHFLRRAL